MYTRQAKRDAKKLKGTPLAKKAKELLGIIREDPFAELPPYEALVGDLRGAYSRRINIQHRLVYQVYENEKSGEVSAPLDTLRIEHQRTKRGWQSPRSPAVARQTLNNDGGAIA